jgi:hypothetical protein
MLFGSHQRLRFLLAVPSVNNAGSDVQHRIKPAGDLGPTCVSKKTRFAETKNFSSVWWEAPIGGRRGARSP